jgi:hypothetical protein
LLEPGGARSNLRRFWISELAGDQFRKKLRALAGEAEMQIRRLQSAPRGRVGRRPLEAFRQLGDDLIRVFEKTTRKTAEEPDFSRFYRFAAAVCRCLHDSAPEVDGEIPRSPRALRDGLREIWKSVTKKQNEKPLPIKDQ